MAVFSFLLSIGGLAGTWVSSLDAEPDCDWNRLEASKLISSPKPLLPREIQAAMDSIAFDYDYESSVEPTHEADSARAGSSRARERSVVLRRLLLSADTISAVLAGLLT